VSADGVPAGYGYLRPYKKNAISKNTVDILPGEILCSRPATQAGCERRKRPKWGTVNAIRPRSEL
jgi:hypothetical protein